ncbi:nucleotidyl transferase AbiEii/AbiGii toxin family protein [Paradevosia shaoguanensis]|uniref:nucleotidyl transferase AbiEii/AbiGii toxin family protein n=1 Tax=Paradevosia shaoguanensis TaxID=1335043 RepID=UPI003C7380C8
MQFQRPQHQVIQSALLSMDNALLERCHCYFGGGTAIVLLHGEYRLSLDVDFLCADVDGYRELRSLISEHGAPALFGPNVQVAREFRSDQYGIRGYLTLQDQPIKFEIVREARIPLEGTIIEGLGVPVLSAESQFAEKLLANADRCLDKSVAYRDAIDLGYLIEETGNIPTAAIQIAERAYGKDVVKSVGKALEQLAKPKELEHAAATLQMQVADVRAAARRLQAAAVVAWPQADLPEIPEGTDYDP